MFALLGKGGGLAMAICQPSVASVVNWFFLSIFTFQTTIKTNNICYGHLKVIYIIPHTHTYRNLGPELNVGYSIVQMVVSHVLFVTVSLLSLMDGVGHQTDHC